MHRVAAVLVVVLLAGCFQGRGAFIGGVMGAGIGGASGAVTVDNRAEGIGAGILLGYALGSCIGFLVEWTRAGEPDEPASSGIKRASSSGDEDRDGIINRLDGCISAAEDRDGLDDGDGCPEVGTPGDRDEDGVPDARDACPDDVADPGAASGCPRPPE